MPLELLVLLLAWAAIVSLLVVLPWLVIRLTVRVLETDVSKSGAEHAQQRQPTDAETGTALSREPDDIVEPAPVPTTSDEDTDRPHPGGKG